MNGQDMARHQSCNVNMSHAFPYGHTHGSFAVGNRPTTLASTMVALVTDVAGTPVVYVFESSREDINNPQAL